MVYSRNRGAKTMPINSESNRSSATSASTFRLNVREEGAVNDSFSFAPLFPSSSLNATQKVAALVPLWTCYNSNHHFVGSLSWAYRHIAETKPFPTDCGVKRQIGRFLNFRKSWFLASKVRPICPNITLKNVARKCTLFGLMPTYGKRGLIA